MRARRALPLVALLAVSSLVWGPGASWAYWTASASGVGTAGTGTLLPAAGVTATVAPWSDTVEVSWTAASAPAGGEPADGYHVTRVRESDGATSAACGTSAAAATTRLSCTDLAVPDGSYDYLVTAVHRSWTAVSNVSNTIAVDADLTAPTVAVTGVAPAEVATGLHNSSPVTFSLVAADSGGSGMSTITYTVDGQPPTTVTGGTASVNVVGDGPHTLAFHATDAAGHSSTPQQRTLSIDITAPAVTVEQSPGQQDPTRDQPFLFDVVFTEPVTGLSSDDIVLTGTAGATTAVVTGTGRAYQVSVTGTTADGTVAIFVPAGAADDAAGHANTASTSADGTVTRDTTAPPAPSAPALATASDTGHSATDGITKDSTPTFVGTAEVGALVALYRGAVALGTGIATNGTYTVESSTLAEGTLTVTAVAADAAGNTSPISPPGTAVTIDVSAPNPPSAPDLATSSDSGSSSTDNITNDNTLTLNGTAESGSRVTLHAGVAQLGTGTAATGAYSITTGALLGAAYPLTTTATDVAGNTGGPSPATSVTVDVTAPGVLITTFADAGSSVRADGTTTVGDSLPITAVICAANTFPCSGANTRDTITASLNSTTGAWTATSRNLDTCILSVCTFGPGELWVQATQDDVAGNRGTSNVRTGTF